MQARQRRAHAVCTARIRARAPNHLLISAPCDRLAPQDLLFSLLNEFPISRSDGFPAITGDEAAWKEMLISAQVRHVLSHASALSPQRSNKDNVRKLRLGTATFRAASTPAARARALARPLRSRSPLRQPPRPPAACRGAYRARSRANHL